MRKKLLILFPLLTLTIASYSQLPCSFAFVFTNTNASCQNNNDGSSEVVVTGGISPYTYTWSVPVGNTSIANNLLPGNYSVIVSDFMGCIDTAYTTIYADTTPTPSICMVTTDGPSLYNYVYWDQTLYSNVDSFIIYRETTPSFFSRIGAVSSDSLSEFKDTARSIGPANGNPNLRSYKYKIQILDTCGNYSLLSPYHSTIYITDDGLGLFSWSTPYTIEGQPNPVSNYILLCDTANIDFWIPVQTVSGTASSAIDPGFANHSNIANWRVKTAWSISCTPTRATVNTTRSNIKHGLSVTSINELSFGSVVVYPNPANGQVSIGLSPEAGSVLVRFENSLGQLILTETIEVRGSKGLTQQFDINSFPKGIYFISLESANKKVFKKLIVN
ncbi:MAG: hypothetical protein K0S44_922 [Bacteroidetes bacterium]|jgi:hypothetical protein|nr:hypothetical protein [Bacteroidota bacterium]